MKLVWLTDLHLMNPGSEPPRGIDPYERLERCLDEVRSVHLDADLVVITGDLIQLRNFDAYRRLAAIIADLPMPTRLLVGNHDNRDAFVAAFPDAPQAGGFVQGVDHVGGYQLIYLDTLALDGSHHGQLCPDRLEFLDNTLAQNDAPAMLFMHHPPASVGIPALDRLRLKDGDDGLAAVLDRHRGKVRYLLCGHLHRAISGLWQGVPYAVMLSPHVSFALDMSAPRLAPLDEAPGYGIILADRASGAITVHTRVLAGGPPA